LRASFGLVDRGEFRCGPVGREVLQGDSLALQAQLFDLVVQVADGALLEVLGCFTLGGFFGVQGREGCGYSFRTLCEHDPVPPNLVHGAVEVAPLEPFEDGCIGWRGFRGNIGIVDPEEVHAVKIPVADLDPRAGGPLFIGDLFVSPDFSEMCGPVLHGEEHDLLLPEISQPIDGDQIYQSDCQQKVEGQRSPAEPREDLPEAICAIASFFHQSLP